MEAGISLTPSRLMEDGISLTKLPSDPQFECYSALKRIVTYVGSTDPTYELRTDGSKPHQEPRGAGKT